MKFIKFNKIISTPDGHFPLQISSMRKLKEQVCIYPFQKYQPGSLEVFEKKVQESAILKQNVRYADDTVMTWLRGYNYNQGFLDRINGV